MNTDQNETPTVIPQHSNPKRKKKKSKKNSWQESHFPKDNLPVRLPIAAKQPFCVPVPEETESHSMHHEPATQREQSQTAVC